MSHDPHFGSVLAAYGLAAAVIGGMIAAIVLDHLRLKRALSRLAASGQPQPRAGGRAAPRRRTGKVLTEMGAAAPEGKAGLKLHRRPLLLFLPAAAFAALAALFFVRLYSGDASLLPSALVGKEVPAFVLPPIEGLSGKPGFSDRDLRQGQVTLVNVFASWCVPCHQEHEFLMRLSSDPGLARLGVRLFGLSYKDDSQNVSRFLAENGDPFVRAGADRSGRIAIDFGVYGVPETFIVGGDGKIAYRYAGPMTEQAFNDTILPEIKKALR